MTITEPITGSGFALTAAGDLNGTGRWTFVQDGPEVVITYDWKGQRGQAVAAAAGLAVRPGFAANHRWAMATGEESLKLELRRNRATSAAAARADPGTARSDLPEAAAPEAGRPPDG